MSEIKFYNRKLTIGWFLVMVANFLFGVSGIIICSLKLRNLENEDFQMGFFKLSMGFAVCNLILSVLLLVSVLKRDQKYAFLYALLIFLSLFAATIHIESNTHKDLTFLIIFIVFAALCFLWFCVYGSYHIWLKDKMTETEATIV
ncbi:uncharacterized protein LOC125505179 [Dendroctonus ponderosae]|uniref:MARVEL domain-containing protein n=1 Tax=Dendroctonus ponderosae TaxID=77166 RepID=A0AAR5Q432_DENPD|nr:uncharacterized protein LOC109542864 [Dendroctonus ponderosae]XP_048524415.1 uncharacterized protein LOC125505179 [Dendroctonus ponderosae]KAH1012906.1 hypothetical protein HUJ05_011981 [Dendroctonus ponderosae]KAH1012907.1 hypothetical protein HUJ05_011982 [Dendroctonus ponderosae]